jgi:PAS domain S-box-containing protein
MPEKTNRDFIAENQDLKIRLKEAQDALEAIVREEVDALVVSTAQGPQIYTLRGAEKPYRVLIEEMKEGAVMLSDDNCILYSNGGFAKMMKCPLEKLVGSCIESMVSPTFKAAFEELLGECRGVGKKNSLTKGITFVSGDGSLVPTQISVNSMHLDNVTTTFVVVTDLTEHMEAELKHYTTDLEKAGLALFESEQRWATTLASIGDAVIATDAEGRITFMNAVSEALTGWSLSEASLKPVEKVFNIICEDTRLKVENPVARVMKEGRIIGLANHTVLLRRDRTEVPIDDSGAPIKNKNGKTTGVVLIFRDITERKKAEEKLKQYQDGLEKLVEERTRELKDKERLATIGATAGMVGHDIRNPLQAITGDLFLAKSELTSLPDSFEKKSALDSLGEIEKNVDYINKIVQDLQDFTKSIKPNVKETDLEEIFQEVLFKNGIPESITASYEVKEETKKMVSDPDLLKRILNNLISNAVQAMPKGGKLAVLAYREAGDTVITVQDTGVGIPKENKAKLFTPLFTTKAKGQGFGLPVVKRLTEALGGTVAFESEVGQGTTFIVRLPSK